MAAGATYEPIATQTLASAAASITFSSIAASWTDLRLVVVTTATTAAPDIQIQFNGVTTNTYSRTSLIGTGASAISNAASSQTYILLDYSGISTTLPSLYEMDFFSYASSNYKTMLCKTSEDHNGSGDTCTTVGLWRSTAAITSIYLFLSGYNFAIGTTATLYGIKAA
jgi:hypothetical protein